MDNTLVEKYYDELYHYGILGMKWGVRRYQNKDGSLTNAGKKHLANTESTKPVEAKDRNGKTFASKKEYFADVRDREVTRLATLSGKNKEDVSEDDLASFNWDVEGTAESHWFSGGRKPLSSNNESDIKTLSKELKDYVDYNLDLYKRTEDEHGYLQLSSYSKRYMKDMDAYSKAVLETVEDWNDDILDQLKHSGETDDELYHHGITGMKWGVRRYQNKDGSLTNAGKRRYGTKANFEKVQSAKKAAAKANSKQAVARRKANERTAAEVAKYKKMAGIKDETGENKSRPKTMKEMSDEELISAINRTRLEQQYSQLHPAKVSKGKKFMESLTYEVVLPAAKNAGKNWVENKLKDTLGLNEKSDGMNALKKEVERANLQKQLKELKKEADPELEKLKKEVERKRLEKEARDLDKPEDDYKTLQKTVQRKTLERQLKKLEEEEQAEFDINKELDQLSFDDYKKERKKQSN